MDGYNLIVADTGNNRVQVLSADTGQFLRLIGGTVKKENRKRPEIYSELNEPEELAINNKGMQLAVADTGKMISY